MNLSDAITLHAAALRRKNRSIRTIDFYANWLHALDEHTHHKPIESLTLTDLRAWVDALFERGLGPGSIRGAAMTAKVFFRWCTREGVINVNAAERLELPQCQKKAPDVLTTSEILTLINDLQRNSHNPIRDTALICFWSETGCRIAELATLEPHAVHVQEHYGIVEGKGNKQRWIFFGDASEIWLTNWLKVRPQSAESLFNLSPAGLRDLLARLEHRTGVRLHPHKFRRSAATLRAAKGMTAPALQEAFGWERLETANKYVVAADTMRQANGSNPLDNQPVPGVSN